MKVYQAIAKCAIEYQRALLNQDVPKQLAALETVRHLEKHLPHGSGFNNGTLIEIEKCNAMRLVIVTNFHKMDENGLYGGWNKYTIKLYPSFLQDYTYLIQGRENQGLRSFVADEILDSLEQEVAQNSALTLVRQP